MIPAPTLFRCFGCDCTTRDAAKVVIASDGRLRCAECAAYEARLAAPPVPAVNPVTGDVYGGHILDAHIYLEV